MSQRFNGGLAGKERHSRLRDKTSKWYADHLMAEYLDPEDKPSERKRFIPVRRQSELLAAAWSMEEESVSKMNRQLELPLAPHGDRAESWKVDSNCTVADTRVPDGVIRLGRLVWTNKNEAHPSIKSERLNAMETVKSPAPMGCSKTAKSSFTWPGFLFGCALGGVAAGFALILLNAVVN